MAQQNSKPFEVLVPKVRQGLLTYETGAIEETIRRTPARSIRDMLLKMQLAEALVRAFQFADGELNEDGLEPENRLLLAACADLKRLTDQGET